MVTDQGGEVMSAPDGLDIHALRALREPRRGHDRLISRIHDHLDSHDGYVAFSGGKDSLVTVHLAIQADPDVPIVFFDSGLEYPETYRYIADIAQRWRLNMESFAADPPLLTLLARSGHWDHESTHTPMSSSVRDILINEPACAAHEAHGPGELWGVRADESTKGTGRWSLYYSALATESKRSCIGCCTTDRDRRARHGGVFTRADGTRVFGPLWDWSTSEVWGYIAREQLPVNPVYDKLASLGTPPAQQRVSHILDGAFLEYGRITRLRRGWPSLYEEIAAVLPRVREFV